MDQNRKRFDERDIQFSRHRLIEGTGEYHEYYSRNPHLRGEDDRIRALPGLLSRGSLYFDDMDASAASASFALIEALRGSVEGESSGSTDHSPEDILPYLVGWMKHQGADAVGTGPVNPSTWYSHVGRGTGGYGSEIPVEHEYALVIGCEMKAEPTSRAPKSPEVVEAAARYAQCAFLAVQAAEFLRRMGYSARAHIDGNYRVIATEAARETGMGSYGWSGLLLTEKYGPRMRFSVVTTDLPSPPPEKPAPDFLKFCSICRKCAGNCPSRSISTEEPGKVNGDRCFAYWNTVGTDCGVCMAVCPLGRNPGFLKELALRYRPAARLFLLLDVISFRHTKEQQEGKVKWKGSK